MSETETERLGQLVNEAKAGNKESFSEIVRIMMRPLIAYTYRMTQDSDVATDLAQTTFIQAWTHLKGLKDAGSFKSWLFRIASNKTLNYLNSRKRETQADSYQLESLQGKDNPESDLVKAELRERVLRFMRLLPIQQRRVFNLRFYHSLSFNEISNVTDKSVGTVKTHYRYAIAKLRTIAKEESWLS